MNTVRCTPPQCWLCTRRNNNKLHLKQKTPSSCLSLYKGPLNTFCHKCWPFSQLAKGLCLQDPAPLLWKCESVIRSVVSDSLLPQECSLPGSSVHGVFQARILEWVVIPFSRGSSQPRAWTCVSCIAERFFTIWATTAAPTIMKEGKGRRIWSWETANWWLAQRPWHKILVLFPYCFITLQFPFKNWMRWKMS